MLLGTTLLILWLLSRMTLLGWADLSYVLPVTSIGYVLSAVLGKVFFGEQVTWQRWLGTVFIVIGIIFVGLTAANTTRNGSRRMKWAMVWVIVGSTVLADLLQSFEMKRHSVTAEDLRPGRLARRAARAGSARPAGAGRFLHGDLVLRLHEAAVGGRLELLCSGDCGERGARNRAARLVLRENVTALRWAGALCVACGVALLAM